MNKLRFGMIGSNFVADWFAESCATVPACEVTAIYSRARETGDAFAKKHGIPHVYTDLEEMYSSGRIDAVYVASPNYAHFAQAIAAMKHGLHVLCEKPAGLSSRQLAEMEETAKANHVVFLEAMRPAFDPATALLEKCMDKVGTLRRCVFRMNQYSSRYNAFLAGDIKNAFNPALGNAAIMDIGVYCVFMCARLLGAPDDVKASSIFLHNGFEGEGTLLLSYPGKQALIEYSKITDSVPGCVLEGEKGYVAFDRVSGTGRVEICRKGEEPEVYTLDTTVNNMHFEIEKFAECVYGTASAEEYLRVTRIQTAIIDAARAQAGIVFPGEA